MGDGGDNTTGLVELQNVDIKMDAPLLAEGRDRVVGVTLRCDH